MILKNRYISFNQRNDKFRGMVKKRLYAATKIRDSSTRRVEEVEEVEGLDINIYKVGFLKSCIFADSHAWVSLEFRV